MVALVVVLAQATGCPPAAAAAVDSAWRALRANDATSAVAGFARADSLCRGIRGAATGAGFAQLRRGDTRAAGARFARAVAADSTDADAWYGLGLARRRQGDTAGARAAWTRALRVAPAYADAEDALLAMGDSSPVALAPPALPDTPAVPAHTSGERFEVLSTAGWTPFYVRGINLGAALPGKFPSEFPTDDSTYAAWLALMAGAHANTVRVYTILPPAFYRALKAWNDAHPGQALWLVHGAWAEPPPRGDYDAPAWKRDFRAELTRVADVIHGRARIPARLGHAWGRYTADVSDHVLALLIGREWEPATIAHFDSIARRTRYAGRFLAVDSATPADVWMAEQCDYALGYEWDRYRAARPVGYTSWPTLDPLPHPTEPTAAEEQALRRRFGFPPNPRLKEYANDGVSLDASLVHATAANRGGWFAAYHAYPYYPDFVSLDTAYAHARASDGPSHYFGYLEDLRRHYAGMPVLIAEYGVPSSRGDAHLQPEGFDHGGHDEQAMADLDVRLTREIREAGYAGGIVFAWLDEWFKHNWPVIDLERPGERTRLWHNVMDAEQNFGLVGECAGDSTATPEPGGDPARWRALGAIARDSAVLLRAGADASYLYLAIETPWPLAAVGWDIGLDPYPRAGADFEFMASLRDTAGGELRVVPWYNPYLGPRADAGPTALDRFYNFGADVRRAGRAAAYDSLFITTNRWRIARDGRTFPARGWNRGRLRFGAAAASTLADWFIDRDAGLVELRLAWGLLNVTDPSSRTVLTRITAPDDFATAVTPGLRVAVAPVDRVTGRRRAWFAADSLYRWPTWETPVWHERLKPAYFALRDLWTTW